MTVRLPVLVLPFQSHVLNQQIGENKGHTKNKNYGAEYSRDDIVILCGFLQWQIQCITFMFSIDHILGLIIDDSISWKAHIDQIMSKLNTACFVIRRIQAMMSQEILHTYIQL